MFKIERVSGATGQTSETQYVDEKNVSKVRAEMREVSRRNPEMSSDTIKVTEKR